MKFPDIHNVVRTPLLDVVRMVIMRGNKVLLVQESDDINWKLPGGKTHADETVFEALKREILEELGVDITEKQISHYIATNIPHSEHIRHIFLITGIEEGNIVKTDEIAEAQFFGLNELPETKFREHIVSAVEIITG